MCYIEKKNKFRVPLWADLLIFLVLLFIASLIGVESTLSLIGSTDFESVKYSFLSAIISSIMVFLVIWLQHCIIDKRPLSELGLCTTHFVWKHSSLVVVWTFIVFAIGFLICLLSGDVSIVSVHWNLKDLSLSLLMFTFGAFYEEIIMRGYLLTRLCRSGLNVWLCLIITAIIFSAMHLANPNVNFCSVVNLFLFGILDGCIFLYTKSLWVSVIAHCAWNWIQGSIFGFKVSGCEFFQPIINLDMPSYNLVNGGLFGFEGSIICTILLIPFIIIFINLISKSIAKDECQH